MFQFCVSGATKGDSYDEGKELAWSAGEAIAEAGHSLITGATIGLPNMAAEGYKHAGGGCSLGVSPATSKIEHVRKYRLPTKAYDVILYSGLHYVGRDALLINSCDAVISVGGRMGTLHEFTIAVETGTPIGILQGAGGVSNEIMDLLHVAGGTYGDYVVFSDDPKDLLKQLTELLNTKYKGYLSLYD